MIIRKQLMLKSEYDHMQCSGFGKFWFILADWPVTTLTPGPGHCAVCQHVSFQLGAATKISKNLNFSTNMFYFTAKYFLFTKAARRLLWKLTLIELFDRRLNLLLFCQSLQIQSLKVEFRFVFKLHLVYQALQRRGEWGSVTVAGSNKLWQWLQVRQDLWYTLSRARAFLSHKLINFLHFSHFSSFLKTESWASILLLRATQN